MQFIEGENQKFLIVLQRNENLMETLTKELGKRKFKGGLLSGIGALKEVELGYYDLEHKNYIRKLFDEDDYELLHLSGNLTLKENHPFVHAHVVLGKRDFTTFGGHLFEAKVAVTAEVWVTPLGQMPIRKDDPQIGLALICGL